MIPVPETNSSSPFKSILLSFSSFFEFFFFFFRFILSSDIFIIIIVDGSGQQITQSVEKQLTHSIFYMKPTWKKNPKWMGVIDNGPLQINCLSLFFNFLLRCRHTTMLRFFIRILNIIFAFINNQATKLHSLWQEYVQAKTRRWVCFVCLNAFE